MQTAAKQREDCELQTYSVAFGDKQVYSGLP